MAFGTFGATAPAPGPQGFHSPGYGPGYGQMMVVDGAFIGMPGVAVMLDPASGQVFAQNERGNFVEVGVNQAAVISPDAVSARNLNEEAAKNGWGVANPATPKMSNEQLEQLLEANPNMPFSPTINPTVELSPAAVKSQDLDSQQEAQPDEGPSSNEMESARDAFDGTPAHTRDSFTQSFQIELDQNLQQQQQVQQQIDQNIQERAAIEQSMQEAQSILDAENAFTEAGMLAPSDDAGGGGWGNGQAAGSAGGFAASSGPSFGESGMLGEADAGGGGWGNGQAAGTSGGFGVSSGPSFTDTDAATGGFGNSFASSNEGRESGIGAGLMGMEGPGASGGFGSGAAGGAYGASSGASGAAGGGYGNPDGASGASPGSAGGGYGNPSGGAAGGGYGNAFSSLDGVSTTATASFDDGDSSYGVADSSLGATFNESWGGNAFSEGNYGDGSWGGGSWGGDNGLGGGGWGDGGGWG